MTSTGMFCLFPCSEELEVESTNFAVGLTELPWSLCVQGPLRGDFPIWGRPAGHGNKSSLSQRAPAIETFAEIALYRTGNSRDQTKCDLLLRGSDFCPKQPGPRAVLFVKT